MAGNSISIIIRAQNNASGDLSDIRIDIEQLDRAAGRAQGGMDRLGGAMRGLGGIATAATAGIAAIGAGLGALGAGSLQAGGNFEEAMNEFAAVKSLDQTSESFQQAREAAIEMGTTTKFSATEAASALTFLGRAGFSSADAVSSLPGVLNLAAASGMDLASTADIASNILSGFGMEISQLGELNDVLAATAANANVDVRMLGTTFQYAGPVARSAGLSLEQTAAAIGKLGDAGIQGSSAGTALRAGLLQMQAPTDKAQKALNALGVTVTDSQGNLRDFVDIMQDMNAAGASVVDWKDIVGTEAATAFDLLTQNADDLEALGISLETVDGAAGNMADTMNQGFNAAVKGLGSAFEGLQIAVFDAGLGELATTLTNDLANGIRALATNDVFLEQITAAFTIFIESLRSAQQFVSAVMQSWNAIFTSEASTIEGRMGVWAETTAQTLFLIKEYFETLAQFFTTVFARLRGDTSAGVGEIGARMEAWVSNTTAILNQFRNIFNAISNFVTAVFGRMRGDMDAGSTGMSASMNALATNIAVVLNTLQSIFGSAFSFIQQRFQAFIDVFTGSTSVQDYFMRLAAFMRETQQEIAAGLRSWISGAIATAFNFYVEKIREAGTNAQVAFREWLGQIQAVFTSIAAQARTWGANILSGIAGGIRDGLPSISGMMEQAAETIRNTFKRVLGISSPSTVFEGYGFNMIEGAIIGIRSNAAAAIGEVEGLANQIEAVLRHSLETTRNYVSAISMDVQAGLRGASDVIPQLQAQAEELRGRLQGMANEDGSFVGLSEDALQVAQTTSQQLQTVESQLSTFQSQVDQAAQASASAAEAEQRRAQAAADAQYQYERATGAISDPQHLQNLERQAASIYESAGATAEYYNTLTEANRVQEQIAQTEQQALDAQNKAMEERQQRARDFFAERQRAAEEAERAEEERRREEERAAAERQRAAEELNETMMNQAENVYTSQVLSGMISLADQIRRVESEMQAAEHGTNEWLAAFRELQTLTSERDQNLFELQFIEGDFTDLEELRIRLESTRSTLEGLQNQRGSSAYLSALQEEIRLEEAVTEELERQRQSRLDSLRIDAERERRRAEARTPIARADDPDQQPYLAANVQRAEGSFTSLADAVQKSYNAGQLITDGFFDYLASQSFSRDVTGSVVNLTKTLMALGDASRGDVRSALETQKAQLEELLSVLPEGSERWLEYAQALASVNKELQDMSDQDAATKAAATAAAIDRAGNAAGREANMNAFTSGNRSAREALGVAQTSYDSSVALREKVDPDVNPELYNELSNNIDSAAADIEKFKSAMKSVPMKFLGQQMLSLAVDNIPFLGGVIQGFATAGPLGGLISLFSQLAGESEALAEIGEMVMTVVQPIIGIFDQLFTALKPLIGAVLDLMTAFYPLVEIALKILMPVFKLLGKVMSAVTDAILFVINGFISAYNALLGWLFGRIDKVERTNYDKNEEDAKGKTDSGTGQQDERNSTTDFGGVPPTVQLAIATPLVEAAEQMLYAAQLMVSAFRDGVETGARTTQTGNNLSILLERHAAAMTRHSVSLDAASTVLDRLVSEGLTVQAQSNVTVEDTRSKTLSLR